MRTFLLRLFGTDECHAIAYFRKMSSRCRPEEAGANNRNIEISGRMVACLSACLGLLRWNQR
jgi:hypothetical protein